MESLKDGGNNARASKNRRDLDEQKKVTEKVTQNINCTVEDKFKLINEKYEHLREKCENQEKRLYFLEKQARKNNIVLFGIKEIETSYFNLDSLIVREGAAVALSTSYCTRI